jgi:hypothetical protein
MAECATAPSLNLKGKGDLAELMVATDLLRRGHKIAILYGEDCDFDLVLIRGDRLERVQVKHARSDGSVINVRCHSHSLTNGKIRRTKHYTAKTIDLLAVYDAHLRSLLLHTRQRAGHWPLNSLPTPQTGKEWAAAAHTASRELPSTPDDGASRNRTGDLSDANRTLCQLSYGPVPESLSRWATESHQASLIVEVEVLRRLLLEPELVVLGGLLEKVRCLLENVLVVARGYGLGVGDRLGLLV